MAEANGLKGSLTTFSDLTDSSSNWCVRLTFVQRLVYSYFELIQFVLEQNKNSIRLMFVLPFRTPYRHQCVSSHSPGVIFFDEGWCRTARTLFIKFSLQEILGQNKPIPLETCDRKHSGSNPMVYYIKTYTNLSIHRAESGSYQNTPHRYGRE